MQFHISIHMRNIFLNEHDVPKLSTFGFSVSIPEGETQTTPDQGFEVFWYESPNNVHTGKVTEKADVY